MQHWQCSGQQLYDMPSTKYESQDTTKVTSDLVLLDHEASDNENEGGRAKANGDADGAETKGERLEWHRSLVDWYKNVELGAVEGMEVIGKSTTKTGEDLAKWQEDVEENLEQAQADATKQFNQFTDLLLGVGNADEDDSANQAAAKVERELGLKPGPKIMLKCIDNMDGKLKAKDLEVDWLHSWGDVLRDLKSEFKRDVIFEYEVGGRVIRVQDDSSFDRAMALAEGSGNKLYVVIQQAVWAEPVLEEVEPDEPEPEEEALIITCADRLAYRYVAHECHLFLLHSVEGLDFFFF